LVCYHEKRKELLVVKGERKLSKRIGIAVVAPAAGQRRRRRRRIVSEDDSEEEVLSVEFLSKEQADGLEKEVLGTSDWRNRKTRRRRRRFVVSCRSIPRH
jgi:hypothetical protein